MEEAEVADDAAEEVLPRDDLKKYERGFFSPFFCSSRKSGSAFFRYLFSPSLILSYPLSLSLSLYYLSWKQHDHGLASVVGDVR